MAMHSVLRAARAGVLFVAAVVGALAFSRELTPQAREFPPPAPQEITQPPEPQREPPKHTEDFTDPPEPEPV